MDNVATKDDIENLAAKVATKVESKEVKEDVHEVYGELIEKIDKLQNTMDAFLEQWMNYRQRMK